MPEIEDPAAARVAEKPGAVHDVGLSFQNGLQDREVLVRVVLEIAVLDDDDVPC